MDKFWILIFVLFFATNSFDKSESVDLFDEIFGEGWWDNDKDEEWHKLTLEQNLHQIDQQNTQIGQIEPNSTDQLGQIEPNSTDQLGQIEPNSTDQLGEIEPNSTDQNPPLTEWKRKLGQTKSNKHSHSEQKELMKHYYEIKDKNSKTSDKDIAKMLNIVSRTLRRWKKQFNPNSVNSVEKNAAANVQEIGN
uniref:Uncharacterized protein n=1 Tax=Globodera rostochiensis TaxID=31243 RepID=A0A914HSK0_GLORO